MVLSDLIFRFRPCDGFRLFFCPFNKEILDGRGAAASNSYISTDRWMVDELTSFLLAIYNDKMRSR